MLVGPGLVGAPLLGGAHSRHGDFRHLRMILVVAVEHRRGRVEPARLLAHLDLVLHHQLRDREVADEVADRLRQVAALVAHVVAVSCGDGSAMRAWFSAMNATASFWKYCALRIELLAELVADPAARTRQPAASSSPRPAPGRS